MKIRTFSKNPPSLVKFYPPPSKVSTRIVYVTFLPQLPEQARSWYEAPTQVFPPLMAAGLLQFRVRRWNPEAPQLRAVQLLYAVHAPHPPSTVKGNEQYFAGGGNWGPNLPSPNGGRGNFRCISHLPHRGMSLFLVHYPSPVSIRPLPSPTGAGR